MSLDQIIRGINQGKWAPGDRVYWARSGGYGILLERTDTLLDRCPAWRVKFYGNVVTIDADELVLEDQLASYGMAR